MARAGASVLSSLLLASSGTHDAAVAAPAVAGSGSGSGAGAGESGAVLTGAIRWDAWFGAPAAPHEGIIGRATTKSLSPAKFHYRLPFFAKIKADGSVEVNGDSAVVMAQENKFATQHGIDYYAFCTCALPLRSVTGSRRLLLILPAAATDPIGCSDYSPPDSACVGAQCCADNYKLSYALERYLASPEPKPRFSLILQASSWYPGVNHGSNETLEQEAARYTRYFALPAYQKVAGNRPLVFLLGGSAAVPHLPEALDMLRQRSAAAGLGEPFFFMMQNAPTPAALAKLANSSLALGASGLSQYVSAAAPFASSFEASKKRLHRTSLATAPPPAFPTRTTCASSRAGGGTRRRQG